ncbi:Alpha-galactosidase 2 [Hibiscus syriacus]|uniref:Alpha-galactosidase 2 n=1 Tax=Hibiscus syriacus TaxID=106335 RepID=A0A6A2WKC4_HIBSY|nr:TIR-only protein-like [Hibiscus syriacus]KAE8659718.1 Alpha-galactosidase 2 [Hibiscus syriacus]
MQLRGASSAKSLYRKILEPKTRVNATTKTPCDIFINHRGIDTKKKIAGLLDDHFYRMGLRPFLDNRNMQPGDRLYDEINPAIRNCKIGVAVFSPNYCDSHFCLHELALLIENKKRVIPIFCDVKPSQLRVMDYGMSSAKELERFSWALEEAKHTVGLTFDTLTGDWSHFLNTATDAVIKNLAKLEAGNSSKSCAASS